MSEEKQLWKVESVHDDVEQGPLSFECVDLEGRYSVRVDKWGCVDYRLNHPRGRIHLCSIDVEIERLQALKALAIKTFDGFWEG